MASCGQHPDPEPASVPIGNPLCSVAQTRMAARAATGRPVRITATTSQRRKIRVKDGTVVPVIVANANQEYQQIEVDPDLGCYLKSGSDLGRSDLTVGFYMQRMGAGQIGLRSGVGCGATCECDTPYPFEVVRDPSASVVRLHGRG